MAEEPPRRRRSASRERPRRPSSTRRPTRREREREDLEVPPTRSQRDRARVGDRRRRQPPREKPRRSETLPRVLVAIPLVIFAIFVVFQGGIVFAAAIIVLGVMSLHELYRMLEPARPVKIAGFVAVGALVLAALWGGQFQVLMVMAFVLPALFVLALARGDNDGMTIAMATTLLGIWWVGLALGHAMLLRNEFHGNAILIDVLVGTFIGDTAAYFGGRLFGSRPLAPRISPNKTVEGLVFQIVGGVAAVWFAGLYQDWLSGTDALLLGLAVAIAAPLGDLFESAIKRDVGEKDTGAVFGAHGGVLDRLDAVFFSVIVGFYVWHAIS
jgi:phosphatidate cytidylyltransferase